MNNSYCSYVDYIKSTSYYNDLSSALTKVETISNNIDSLINALGKTNGPNITSAINDLESFKTKLNKISSYYGLLKNSLNDNANEFDRTLSWAKSEYDNVNLVLYYFDGDIVDNHLVWFGLFANFNIHGITYKASKTMEKNKVKICESSGYIIRIRDIDSISYTLKPKHIIQSFDIECGTPNDIIVNTNSLSQKMVVYYAKNNQEINLSN